MTWCRSDKETGSCPPLPLFCFFLSVLSLGQITYFINRPAYHNLDIIHIPAVILICILANLGLPVLRPAAARLKTLSGISLVQAAKDPSLFCPCPS